MSIAHSSDQGSSCDRPVGRTVERITPVTVAVSLALALAAAPMLSNASTQPTPQQAQDVSSQATASSAQEANTQTGYANATLVAQAAAPASAAAASAPATTSQNGAAAINQLQEVTVTAERIATSELRTPISITAMSTQQIAQTNVINTGDLKGLVPSLQIVQSGGYGVNQMSVDIRGVGGEPRFFNQHNGVGFYFDDLYVPTGQNLNLDFYDMSSLQILKGPQGTLFGRNTLGGAMLMQPTPPSQQFGGYVQVSVGNYNRLDTQGAINMPFSDVLTSRLAFNTSNVDGYINDIYDNRKHNDVNEKAARYELRFQPTSRFTADLLGALGNNHDNGDEEIEVNCNPNGHYIKDYDSVHTVPFCTQFPPLGLPYTIYGTSTANFPNPQYNSGPSPGQLLGPSNLGMPHFGGFTPYTDGTVGTGILHLAYDVNDNLTLKSITGVRYSILDSYRDQGTPGGLYTESNGNWLRNWSEELQALYNGFNGRLNVVAGLYYYHDHSVTLQDTGPDYDDPVGYYYANIQHSKSTAFYMQATGYVTPKFSIVAGIRYTRDSQDTASKVWEGCYGSYAEELSEYQTGGPDAYSGGCWIPGPTSNSYAAASNAWHHTDPRLQLQYQWTQDVMSYLSATSGYLAGGFNPQLPYFPPPGIPASEYYNAPFQEETTWNYEFGTKGEWFDHRLRVDFAAYDQIFDNFQAGVLEYYGPNGISTTPTVGSIDVTTVTSAADAHERGVEVEVDAIPIPNMTVQLTYAYMTQGFDTIFPAAVAAGLSKHAVPNAGAPPQTYSFVGNYTFHLSNGATIVPALNWRYVGANLQGTYPLLYMAPGYGLVGGTLAWNSPGDKWSIALWGNNVLNKYYYQSFVPADVLNTNFGISTVEPGVPREWGLRFRWNY